MPSAQEWSTPYLVLADCTMPLRLYYLSSWRFIGANCLSKHHSDKNLSQFDSDTENCRQCDSISLRSYRLPRNKHSANRRSSSRSCDSHRVTGAVYVLGVRGRVFRSGQRKRKVNATYLNDSENASLLVRNSIPLTYEFTVPLHPFTSIRVTHGPLDRQACTPISSAIPTTRERS